MTYFDIIYKYKVCYVHKNQTFCRCIYALFLFRVYFSFTRQISCFRNDKFINEQPTNEWAGHEAPCRRQNVSIIPLFLFAFRRNVQ